MRTAARIADAMKAAGLNKSQFARKMGKSPSEITKWLSGTHNFTIDTLVSIEAALGAPILQVYHGKEYPTYDFEPMLVAEP